MDTDALFQQMQEALGEEPPQPYTDIVRKAATCPDCWRDLERRSDTLNYYSCSHCGYEGPHWDDGEWGDMTDAHHPVEYTTGKPVSSDTITAYYNRGGGGSYRRVVHFRDYINRVQGMQLPPQPAKVAQLLREQFTASGIELSTVTLDMVSVALRKSGCKGLKPFMVAIYRAVVPGNSTWSLRHAETERLCEIVGIVERLFTQYVTEGRRRFFDLSFLLAKLLPLIGRQDLLQVADFKLGLSTAGAVERQERLWAAVEPHLLAHLRGHSKP